MQPARNQCANGTQNPNFIMKLGMINPWQAYFPKIKQKEYLLIGIKTSYAIFIFLDQLDLKNIQTLRIYSTLAELIPTNIKTN